MEGEYKMELLIGILCGASLYLISTYTNIIECIIILIIGCVSSIYLISQDYTISIISSIFFIVVLWLISFVTEIFNGPDSIKKNKGD